MAFEFHKCHSLGNDFVMILAQHGQAFDADTLRRIADRHRGVGFDQLMWCWPADADACDYFVRIFNSDGSESGQCINGLRSTGYLLQTLVNPSQSTWRLSVMDCVYTVMATGVQEYGLQYQQPPQSQALTLALAPEPVTVQALDLGNPHAVWRVLDSQRASVDAIAQQIAVDRNAFPQGVNVGVCECVDEQGLRLRVLERGAGWTDACGSGAMAAALAAKQNGWFDGNELLVRQPGGVVKVSWLSGGLTVRLCGPVAWVYSGKWHGNEAV